MNICVILRVHRVLNEPFMFILYKFAPVKVGLVPGIPAIAENPKFHLSVRDYIAGHIQFYENQNVERFRQINSDLMQSDCIANRMRASLIILLSQFSPVSATRFLGFENCHRIHAVGTVGVLAQCKTVNVSLTAMQTTCSAEPSLQINGENFTLAHDDATLKKCTPCYCQFSMFSLTDGLFEWKDGQWRKSLPAFHALQKHSHSTFTSIIDKSESLFPESFSETPSELFTMLGELNGLSNEQGEKLVGKFVENTIQQASVQHSGFNFNKIKDGAVAILVVGAKGLTLYLLILHTSFRTCCCALFQATKIRFTRPQPPDAEEAAAATKDVPSMFYRSGADSVEFRDIDLRSALSHCGSAPPERPAPLPNWIYPRVVSVAEAGPTTRDAVG